MIIESQKIILIFNLLLILFGCSMEEMEPEFIIKIDPSLSDKIIINVQTIYNESGYQISKINTLYYKGEIKDVEATINPPVYYRFFVSYNNEYFGDSGVVYNYMFRRKGHKNIVDISLDKGAVIFSHTVGDAQFDWNMKINQKYDDIVKWALNNSDKSKVLYDLLTSDERTEVNYDKFYSRMFFSFFNNVESNIEIVPLSESGVNYYKKMTDTEIKSKKLPERILEQINKSK